MNINFGNITHMMLRFNSLVFCVRSFCGHNAVKEVLVNKMISLKINLANIVIENNVLKFTGSG